MKNKNIYFVGHFQGIKKKMKFVNLFNCKNKSFLESSIDNINSNGDDNIQYFPEQVYKIKTQFKHLFTTKKIVVDSLVREVYRRDYQHYKTIEIDIKTIGTSKKILLLLLFSIQKFNQDNKGISKLNVLRWLKEFNILNKLSRSNNIQFLTAFKNFMFRINFIIGYRYIKKILDSLAYSKNDIYIIWGKSYSSRLLLINYLDKHKVPYFISEYGEIPGTISCSPNGIFGEIFSENSWKELYEKEVKESDLNRTEQLLNQVKEGQISTRNYDSNMYFLMKYFYENSVQKENKQKIIYVNGSELFSSGLYWNRWNIGNQGKHPNKMLLEKVVSYFDKDDYMIIYKEHPMTMSQSKNGLLLQSDFPTVNFIESMDIHDILDMADIVVTFPSKVAMTSIEYHKKTFVLGDFTIPHSIPSINYFTSRNFEDIQEVFTTHEETNPKEYIEFVTRMLKYSLIIYDKNLFYDFSVEKEKAKIANVIDNQKYIND